MNKSITPVLKTHNAPSNKQAIYDYIYKLATQYPKNLVGFDSVPISITREHVAVKFNLSIRQVERILAQLEDEKKIYRYKLFGNINIYSLIPIDMTHDIFVRFRP